MTTKDFREMYLSLPSYQAEWDENDTLVAEQICDQWYAEHPQDDDQVRNDAWLRSVGFEPDPNDKAFLRLPLIDEPYKAFLVLESTFPDDKHCGYSATFTSYSYGNDGKPDDEDLVQASAKGATKTRGQVRRLCAALGKPLEERP